MHLVAQVKRLKGEPELTQEDTASFVAMVPPPAMPHTPPVESSPTEIAPDGQEQPSSDLGLLAEVLAASSLQNKSEVEPFIPERETANAAAGQNGEERFSPFPFDPDNEKSSTPRAGEDEKFSPFEEFKPIAGEAATANGPDSSKQQEKPVVLFELPKAPTPLSDLENDNEPLYQSEGPGHMPLGSTTVDSEA